MPGMLPNTSAGGVITRTIGGVATNPPNVLNAYVPPAGFVSTQPLTALPESCDCQILPSQINGLASELLALARELNPTGTWSNAAITNVAVNFAAWAAGNTAALALKAPIEAPVFTNFVRLQGEKGIGSYTYDTFTYATKTTLTYGLGWFTDTTDGWNASGPTGWLSAYAGLKFFTLNLPRLSIAPDGKVGIGVTAPNEKLTVAGNAMATAFNATGSVNQFNGTGGAYLAGLAGNPYAALQAYSDGAGTAKILALNATGGLVGIGTTTPGATLHVRYNYGVSGGLRLDGQLHSGRLWDLGETFAVGAGKFNITDTTAGASRVTIDTSGNIGLGPTAPTTKLDVDGPIRSRASYTVATLPAAGTVGLGTMAFVTDSNATLAAGHGNTVVGGGANITPVWSNNSNWIIG